jgi:RNA polymerase sigma-70 factor (ECF subfamily)
MVRMADGDQRALTELMRRHSQRLYRVAVGYLRNADEAMEAVQEAFVKAHRGAERWDRSAQVGPWLTRIIINESIDRYRRARRRRAAEEPLDEADPHGRWAAEGPSPERRVLGRELREHIDSAVGSLPDRQRAIFVLRHYEGMELQEIAGALNMRLGTVKSGLHRAVYRLRELLAPVAR